MHKHILAGLGALTFATAATAGPADVNAQAFYVDAVELVDKGMGALFDKRTKPRMAQLKAAGQLAREENEAGKARGKPVYCVSEAERKKGIDAKKAVKILGAVPENDRRKMTLAQAWRAGLIREYPCG